MNIEITNDDIGREIALAAARSETDPQELTRQLVESGRLSSLAADIMRRKALDHAVAEVNVVNRPTDETEEAAVAADQPKNQEEGESQ